MLYRSDCDGAFDRLTAWWQGKDIGRPALLIRVPRENPHELIPALPRPEGWTTDYSTRDYAYRVNLGARACVATDFLGEAIPQVSPDLGPNCLALYLGCRAVDGNDTVWFTPCIENLETAQFAVSPDNFYWRFTLRLARELLKIGDGKFLVSFPDLIEGLDTLAAMRGTEEVLFDLVERPQLVAECLTRITQRYFECYDALYEMIRDSRGGSHYWVWAPGRLSKLQCDFSAMISPTMFNDLMVPVLREMTRRLDYCIYHWDGPGAIPHHDALLAIPGITAIQWTAGAGAPPVWDRRWWPLYHKTIDAGKKMLLMDIDPTCIEGLKAEFGRKLHQFLFSCVVQSAQQGRELIHRLEL